MKKKKRAVAYKKLFFAGGIVIIVVLAFNLVGTEKYTPIPHRNMIDAEISQYSDKHITPNAIVASSEFKNIAFEAAPPSEQFYFPNQFAAVLRAIKSLGTSPEGKGSKEYGSWIWTPVMSMSPEYVDEILSGAKSDGVNAIYVSIDSYLDIFVMEKGKERERQKRAFSEKLDDFIKRANKRGIAVDAEAGWRNWAEEGNIYKAFAVVNYVKNFNASHTNKFRGFQYDVEPYLLDSYKDDPAPILKNFVTLVDMTRSFLTDSELRFSVVVPDFYDGKDGATPQFSYNGDKDFVFGHLLNILDKKRGSSIIIMSYRNFAYGFDGAIEISNNEMQTAKSHSTKVIIAQETSEVPPPYITFHNMSKRHFSNQISKINTAFGSHPNFGGIAVHYVNAFLTLK